MINEINNSTIPYILSNSAQQAHEKIKALIKKIFHLLKEKINDKNLKEEFYNSYVDFARNLKLDGHNRECYNYMAICAMYYNLMDNPNELIAHESFFTDLFNAFDELLFIKIYKPEGYDDAYKNFTVYLGKMREYYLRNLASPSPYYDDDVCKEIISKLAGDF